METFATVSLPLFGIVLLGYVAGRYGFLDPAARRGLNVFAFYFALPAVLFRSLAHTETDGLFEPTFLVGYYGITSIYFAAVVVGSLWLFRSDLKVAALRAETATFSNRIFLGLPLALALYGDPGLAPAAVLLLLDNLFVIAPGLVLLEIAESREQGGSAWGTVGAAFRGIAANPPAIAVAAGVSAAFIDLTLPTPLDRFCEVLGSAAGPAALFAIGTTLAQTGEGGGERREVLAMSALKLFIHPLLVWIVLDLVLDIDPLWTAVAILFSALPTGANVYVFAARYGVYERRTSSVVLVTTFLSMATVSVLLALL